MGKEGITKLLEEGEFECLNCDHIETDKDYLLGKDAPWCQECNCSLYYWPKRDTTNYLIDMRIGFKLF